MNGLPSTRKNDALNVFVDIIVPVHNAESTIDETVKSAMEQKVPSTLIPGGTDNEDAEVHMEQNLIISDDYERYPLTHVSIDIAVCCQDDGSSDDSLTILRKLKNMYNRRCTSANDKISTKLLVGWNADNSSHGAGWARNRAALLREKSAQRLKSPFDGNDLYFLCLLDSDDVMHPYRIAHQVSVMLAMSSAERYVTLLGSTFRRIPADSTWHYTQWANSLSDERLNLEKYREITVLQPTWMISKKRFEDLGRYIEVSETSNPHRNEVTNNNTQTSPTAYRLIHPEFDTQQTLRLAEDLRLFHAHLVGRHEGPHLKGMLKLIRTSPPLLAYRHRAGESQSSSTPRKLLMRLRVKAFVDTVVRSQEEPRQMLRGHVKWTNGFVIWGCGRDGKDFFKALPNDIKILVKAFVDVDEKKIASGYYVVPSPLQKVNEGINNHGENVTVSRPRKRRRGATHHIRIPIIHFSLLASDGNIRRRLCHAWINRKDGGSDELIGRIRKEQPRNFSQSAPQQCYKHDKSDTDTNAFIIDEEACKASECPNVDVLYTSQRKLHAITQKDEKNQRMIESECLAKMPVVVCVAMYRTNGILERNVAAIGRTEGVDLWHFS